jgi:hypothetical protein
LVKRGKPKAELAIILIEPISSHKVAQQRYEESLRNLRSIVEVPLHRATLGDLEVS